MVDEKKNNCAYYDYSDDQAKFPNSLGMKQMLMVLKLYHKYILSNINTEEKKIQ